MRLVVIESPYGTLVDGTRCTLDQVGENVAYARACVKNCLERGEAPYASHLLYTQSGILNDSLPDQRKLGMEAGFAWGRMAELVAVYTDLGITSGMRRGIELALERGQVVEERWIGGVWYVLGTTRGLEPTRGRQ